MNYYFSLDDPQNIVPTFVTEDDSSNFKKTHDETEQNNLYISQNISSCGIFGSNPSENIQRNTDLNCHSSNLEYSTASNYPQSQKLQNKPFDEGFDRLNDEKLLNAKKSKKEPIICEFPGCGKIFPYLSDLKRHSTSHTKSQNHVCNICQKNFSRLDNLKVHERTHNKEMPFECDFPGCGEKFKNQGLLKYHLQKHLLDRQFKCEIKTCLKSFTKKGELIRHYFVSHECDATAFIERLGEKSEVPPNKPEIEFKKPTFEAKSYHSKNEKEKLRQQNLKFTILNDQNDFLNSLLADDKKSELANKSFDVFFDDMQTKTIKKPEI